MVIISKEKNDEGHSDIVQVDVRIEDSNNFVHLKREFALLCHIRSVIIITKIKPKNCNTKTQKYKYNSNTNKQPILSSGFIIVKIVDIK